MNYPYYSNEVKWPEKVNNFNEILNRILNEK